MRKLLHVLLLASVAATPALASPADRTQRQQARDDRQQAREDRSSRSEQSESARPERPQRAERTERTVEPRAQEAAASARAVAAGRDPRDLQAVRDLRRQSSDQQRINAPGAARQRATIERERVEQRRQDMRERLAAGRHPPVSTSPRPGTQPPPPSTQRPTPAVQWNSNWRHNSSYDWYNYRRHHHSLFNLGFYFDPFGWGYQRYDIGWRMWPSYYGSQYWLNDPWMYRLPYAPPGYRWVRYWDDAVLVDTWSGQVVDVMYSFFW